MVKKQDSTFSKIWCYILKHNMVKKKNKILPSVKIGNIFSHLTWLKK